MTKLPGDELLDRVESAVATGLVTEDDQVLGSFGFTHDLVRETLQAAVGGTRRARVHLRVAQALVAWLAGDDDGAGAFSADARAIGT